MPNTPHPQNSASVASILKTLGPQFQSIVPAEEGRHQGPRQKIRSWQIVVGLIGQQIHFHGCFAALIRQLFGVSLSDSALSQRREKLGVEPFAKVVAHALRPLAEAHRHGGCFFKKLRLVGIDGTRWSLLNTPRNNAQVKKSVSRRGEAAFAKAGFCALVELGTHAPLGAATGLNGQSELALAREVLAQLPGQSLLILDRLYGQGPFVDQLAGVCAARASHFLVRVREKLDVQILEKLPDGSAWVEVRVCDPEKPRRVLRTIRVREVRGRVWNRRKKLWSEVRLWTSLVPEQATPEELLGLYARRWEQEIFYKELKIQLRGGDLLAGHTPQSAAQEMLALTVAASVLADERLAAAAASGDPAILASGAVRISFGACRTQIAALWTVLEAGRGLLDAHTEAALIVRVREQIARDALRVRRPRSCERKVRQPVKKWPRMFTPSSITSPVAYEVRTIA
jgi:hypothetical protein